MSLHVMIAHHTGICFKEGQHKQIVYIHADTNTLISPDYEVLALVVKLDFIYTQQNKQVDMENAYFNIRYKPPKYTF